MTKNSNWLVVIPARGGSKGIPNKNILPLNSIPLINYTLSALRSISSLPNIRICVSTDSPAIADVAASIGFHPPFLRPPHLASDTALSIHTIEHAYDFYCANLEFNASYILVLQPTTPFRNTADLLNVMSILEDNPSYDSLVSVVDVNGSHPLRMNTISSDHILKPYVGSTWNMQPRQELQPLYLRNGAYYAFRSSLIPSLVQQGVMIGQVPYAYQMDSLYSLNIDSKSDFHYAEYLATKWLYDSMCFAPELIS